MRKSIPLLLLHICVSNGAIPVNTTGMRTFGHSIKAGKILPSQETTVFEHTCSSPPCTITQIHIPTVGPKGWYAAVLRLYVDGEAPMNMVSVRMNVHNVLFSLKCGLLIADAP